MKASLRNAVSWLLLSLLLSAAPAIAKKTDLFESDFDEEKKPWEEIQAQLPAFPSLSEAIPFEVPPIPATKFFIDPKSISVGNDGVVRFTLIAQSSSGALNISYEGIRCATEEKKLYAFGRQNAWSRNRFAKWDGIPAFTRDPYHRLLYGDFFCPGDDIVNDAKEAIDALRNGIHPRAKR